MDDAKAIEELARAWLASEGEASRRGNDGGTEARARQASAAYETAVTSASREELLIAWHAALQVQHAQEMGSLAWAEARAVSELVRLEYLASEGTR
jgi:hypothetical protein